VEVLPKATFGVGNERRDRGAGGLYHAKRAKIAKRAATIPPFPCLPGGAYCHRKPLALVRRSR
jgi:hypothetical protein